MKMKLMTFKYNRCVFLIFAISLCFSVFSNAQTSTPDSAAVKQQAVTNIAYGVQPTWMVTGAISTVKGSDLQTPFVTNFANRLNGRIPGLTVTPNGSEPGNDNATLTTRGRNTFGVGGTNMLVLVNGVEGNFADLVPEEVESVTLLKDASSTAMYGGRGANGVMLVTTKRGETGKLKVVFSAQQGIQSGMRLPQYVDSYDYARLYNEALVNDGKAEKYTATDLASYQNGDDKYFHPNINWYDQVLRKTAPISNYDLNFSGGNSSVKYFVLLNYIKSSNLYQKTGSQSDFSINGSYQRVNFRANIDINLNKWLSAALTLGGTVVDKANPAANTTDGIFNQMAQLPPNAFPIYNPNKTLSRNSLFSNPLGDILNKGFYTSNGRTLQSTFGFTGLLDMLTKGLSVTARISFNSYFLSLSNKSRTYRSFALSKGVVGDTIYTPYGLDNSLVGAEGSSDQNRNLVYQAFVNYDRTFGIHAVNGVLMYNADEYVISGNSEPVKHINFSGRATYSYDQKYIGELSFSYMGLNYFPKNGRFGLFPAASVGWIVSNEGFLKDNSLVNFLKIRGSYGMVGNDKIGGTSFMNEQYYPYNGGYYFGTGNTSVWGVIQGSPANTNVTWEKEKSANIGIEATLLNHLDLSLDLFNRDRYDILVQPNATVADFMGFTKPYLNQGKANNKGFEATLRYYSDKTKDFQFFAEASLWYYKNKVVYNSEALKLFNYQYSTGQPIGQPFGLVALGFFKDQADINASPKQIWTVVKPGDVKYQDQNGDNKIDDNDSYPIGKIGLPNITGGLHLGTRYKGFDLDLFFQGVTGNTAYFSGSNFQALQNNGQIGAIALNRWTAATAETATYPRLTTYNDDNNFRYSSLWQRDGSFIKLRSVELGYTLPSRIAKLALLDNARFFINGTNLFSLDHMEGYKDAEYGSNYPVLRSFSVGVKVQFR
ncbi:MAG: SusC/RagA family TonB-linked outer membrane protein [Mariniphaga sp.]|nr:SusC/RagA family TonB-linked outer membrane protein [Mariniphaga sp.]